MRKYIVLAGLIFICFLAEGQEKLERESGIRSDEVPEKALSFVQTTYPKSKIKWYKEEGLNSFTIEAKLKWDNQRHSVEFDTAGNLQDIEITIKYETINKDTRSKIDEYLKNTFHQYRINKAQVQLIGKEQELQALIKNRKEKKRTAYLENYELIVHGRLKSDKIINFYELLVDKDGELLKQSKIVERGVNNLIF